MKLNLSPRLRANLRRLLLSAQGFTPATAAVFICCLVAATQMYGHFTTTVVKAQAPAPNFAETLYPVFQKANCRGCHSDEGVASGTRLHFPPDTAGAEEIDVVRPDAGESDRSGRSRPFTLAQQTDQSRAPYWWRKIAPGSPEEQMLRAWVQHLASVPDTAVNAARARLAAVKPAVAQEWRLRRLTHSQYNNTVRDLLGDYSRPADRFPPEDFVNGFKNQTAHARHPAAARRGLQRVRPRSWR